MSCTFCFNLYIEWLPRILSLVISVGYRDHNVIFCIVQMFDICLGYFVFFFMLLLLSSRSSTEISIFVLVYSNIISKYFAVLAEFCFHSIQAQIGIMDEIERHSFEPHKMSLTHISETKMQP
jgi:hypothetical protein